MIFISSIREWLATISISHLHGKVPDDKIKLVEQIFEEECIFEVPRIFENKDRYTQLFFQSKLVPFGFAQAICYVLHGSYSCPPGFKLCFSYFIF